MLVQQGLSRHRRVNKVEYAGMGAGSVGAWVQALGDARMADSNCRGWGSGFVDCMDLRHDRLVSMAPDGVSSCVEVEVEDTAGNRNVGSLPDYCPHRLVAVDDSTMGPGHGCHVGRVTAGLS